MRGLEISNGPKPEEHILPCQVKAFQIVGLAKTVSLELDGHLQQTPPKTTTNVDNSSR
jgi:hypothetical protein